MASNVSEIDRSSASRGILPLPLVIGVTGHRDLREEDREPLEKRVRQVFAELQRDYPHTPLILLSPLAEGADRLVARVALTMKKQIRLIVPLPLPQELYEKDFQSKASLDEFNKLLQQAERLELSLLPGVKEEMVREQGPARDRQYALVGAYITMHSQILIALWDGTYTGQVGGTSQIVQFQLEGVPEPYAAPRSPLDEVESGPVYHVITPRVKNPTPVGQPFTLCMLTPSSSINSNPSYEQDCDVDGDGSKTALPGKEPHGKSSLAMAEQEFDRIFQHLDIFNRDGSDLGPELIKEQAQSKAYLLGDTDITTLPRVLSTTLSGYADLYARADALALYFKNRTVKRLFFLFSLFFIAALFFGIFAHLRIYLEQHVATWLPLPFLVFYLIFLLFSAYYVWFYQETRSDNYKNKYLDYRALAEGLRVQFFWCLVGVQGTVATHYLRKQKSELDWIRNSIRVANLLSDASSGVDTIDGSLSVPENRYRLLLKHWIDDQATYFTRAAKQDNEKLEGKEWWMRTFLVTGIALAFLLLFILVFRQCAPKSMEWVENTALIDLLIIVTSLVLVLAALREGYADKMAYTEQVKQYQHMSRLFWVASQRLRNSIEQKKPQEAERVIQDMGEEALAENGDWVMLHRVRPINMPIGG